MGGADCWSDHRLIRSKVNLQLRRPKRSTNKLPPKFDAKKLDDDHAAAEFERVFEETFYIIHTGTSYLVRTRQATSTADKSALGFRKQNTRGRCHAKNQQTEEVLEKKRFVTAKMLNRRSRETTKAFSEAKREAR